VYVTGYWTLDENSDRSDRTDASDPPPDLAEFLARGEPPVYVGFGSMSGTDPATTTRTVLDAIRRAGVRAVLASGWGGLAPSDAPARVHVVESAPHEWLFPRCAAVVHHGGAGTTAAGLRAGCPSVVCPFFGDQYFWGRRVESIGAGPAPVPQKHLTPDRLATAIREALDTPEMRRRAQHLGTALRSESGVARAVAILERADPSAPALSI
jgi:sterol 3beta-glucosyltransferase